MGKFRVTLTKQAEKDLIQHYRSGNKATIKKIEVILIELSEHPYTGTGKPEELKWQLTGFWSRRINQKDRLIYSVSEKEITVEIITALGHYSDK